jgi:hypothetical protein
MRPGRIRAGGVRTSSVSRVETTCERVALDVNEIARLKV